MRKLLKESRSRLNVTYFLYNILFFISVISFNAYAANISYIETLFLEGRYEKAIDEIDRTTERSSRDRDELFYLKGLCELKGAKYSSARDSFNSVIMRYPNSPKVFEAFIGMADSYYLEGDIDKAIKFCEYTLKKIPNDKNEPLIYYRLCDWYKKKGLDDLAAQYLEKAKESAPLSFEAGMPKKEKEPALIRDVKGKDYFSVQVGSFKTRQNAQRLKANLESAGYDSFIEVLNDAGNYMYRVKIGRFKTQAEANLEAARLRKKHYSTKVCYSNN